MCSTAELTRSNDRCPRNSIAGRVICEESVLLQGGDNGDGDDVADKPDSRRRPRLRGVLQQPGARVWQVGGDRPKLVAEARGVDDPRRSSASSSVSSPSPAAARRMRGRGPGLPLKDAASSGRIAGP